MHSSNFTLHDDLDGSHLATRGWAYQEKILSTRILLFGNWSIHYLCSNSFQTFNGTGANSTYHYCADEIKQALSQGRHFDAWNAIFPAASKFGNHSFTILDDILPALSGLARLVQKSPPDKYLAGHWEQDLFRSLAWEGSQATRPKEVHFQDVVGPEAHTIPSWSILCKSIDGFTIESRICFLDIKFETQSCAGQVNLAGTDPFGAMKNAHLEIRSHCYQHHSQIDRSITIRHFESSDWIVTIDWHCHQLYSVVHLDYDLRISDINQDPRMWRWVLLGSVELRQGPVTRSFTRGPRTNSKCLQLSTPECQELGGTAVGVIGDISKDNQESWGSNTGSSIADRYRRSDYSFISESEEGLGLNHNEGGQRHEPDRSDDRNAQPLTDARMTDNAEDAEIDSNRGPERYPYGLLLFQVPDQQEWYRVGMFRPPDVHIFEEEQKSHPESEPMTLKVLRDMSQIEIMTVI
ncbi:hypothetical protein G7054_g7136 [Neopestalotiopsis clavispora]|nr:hypothetical protein G7054_g7136 [Neopestalotiopsis clavispora]